MGTTTTTAMAARRSGTRLRIVALQTHGVVQAQPPVAGVAVRHRHAATLEPGSQAALVDWVSVHPPAVRLALRPAGRTQSP